MSLSEQQGEWDLVARPATAGEPFSQRFGELVVFLLLFPAPNLVVRRLGGDRGTVCTESTLLLPPIRLVEGYWWLSAASSPASARTSTHPQGLDQLLVIHFNLAQRSSLLKPDVQHPHTLPLYNTNLRRLNYAI